MHPVFRTLPCDALRKLAVHPGYQRYATWRNGARTTDLHGRERKICPSDFPQYTSSPRASHQVASASDAPVVPEMI
jgi:hypothetical protein